MKNVTIFGDSILQGVLFHNRKYSISHAVDWSMIENKLDVKITNSSRMGCTISKGEQIIEKVLSQGRQIDTAVVEYGGNDSDFNWAEVAKNPELPQFSFTPIEIFTEKLKNIISTLRNANIKPLLMTLPPLNHKSYYEKISTDTNGGDGILKFLGSTLRIFHYQELYSTAITEIAKLLNVQLVDVRKKFLSFGNYDNLLCEDGIHPNEQGETVIANCFLEAFATKY